MAAYVVNPAGATHSVDESMVEALLRQGFRLATEDEIKAWYRTQGLEVSGGEVDSSAADRVRSRRASRSGRR